MRTLLIFLAAWVVLAAAGPAEATGRGYGYRGGAIAVGVTLCPYSIDNGCVTAMAGAASIDTNFAIDSAQSGQSTTNRNANLHINGYNIPYVDYAVGSAAPASLAPISSISGQPACVVYNPSGAPSQLGGATNAYLSIDSCPGSVTITGYDFTNGGTASVGILVGVHGSATTSVNLVNDYLKPSGLGQTANGAVIYAPANSFNTPTPLITLKNVTCDGNFASYSSVSGMECILDNRSGPLALINANVTITQSVIQNFGGRPGSGNGGGTFDYEQSAIMNDCLNNNGDHCEMIQLNAANQTRVDKYNGNLYYVAATAQNQSTSSAIFLGTGQTNGTIFSSAVITNNAIVMNKTTCTNPGPWNSSNPCVGGTAGNVIGGQSGYGLFAMDYAPQVTSLTVTGNVVDGAGALYCAGNVATGSNGTSSLTSNMINVTTASTNYSNTVPVAGWWQPGQLVVNVGGLGFTSGVVQAYGANGGTMTGGSATGLGTIQISGSHTDIAGNAFWELFTNVISATYALNYSIASGSANLINFSGWTVGTIACP